MAKAQTQSPLLGAVTSMISAETERMVTNSSQFRHSFEVDVSLLVADPKQARRVFNDSEIAQLGETMVEQGQLQPILVRRATIDQRVAWVIVAGERRWRAAVMNGWTTMLAIEHSGDAEVVALIENLQRVDLSPVEEARGLQRLISERGWPQDKAAQALGKSKGDISSTLRILTLPEALLEKVLTSELTLSKNTLIELARVEEPAARARLIHLAMQGDLTIRTVREGKPPRLKKTPPLTDAMAKITAATRVLYDIKRTSKTLSASDQIFLRHLRQALDALLDG